MRQMVAIGLFLLATLSFVAKASAHFIWIGTEDGEVRVYFGESTSPDKAMFLNGVKQMKAWQLTGEEYKALKFALKKQEGSDKGWFVLDAKPGSPIVADCTYGLFGRSAKKSLLHYTAKYATLDQLASAKHSKKLILEVVPSMKDGNLMLTVFFDGKPVKGSEVRLESSANVETLTTDDTGQVVMKKGFQKRVWIRAKVVQSEAGKWKGKAYEQKSFYSTLVLDPSGKKVAVEADAKSEVDVKAVESSFQEMPVGVTSFGAAVCKDRVFFFGGHCGQPHQYSKDGQNGILYSHSVNGKDSWKEECESTGLQGLAMVSHGGKIYRIGGFRADNESGEKSDLHSVNQFACFDSKNKTWNQLAPLPEARSSFDACVLDGKVYVIGGWALGGKGSKSQWRDTAYFFDFANQGKGWQKIANPPFARRALSVGFQSGKIICVGGMQQKGGPTKKTSIYDPKTNKWSDGPELPGKGRMEGFGTSCFNSSGQLFVSTYGGGLYRLSKDAKNWEKVGELEDPRFFHRVLAFGKNKILIMGGSHMESGKVDPIEVFQVN